MSLSINEPKWTGTSEPFPKRYGDLQANNHNFIMLQVAFGLFFGQAPVPYLETMVFHQEIIGEAKRAFNSPTSHFTNKVIKLVNLH